MFQLAIQPLLAFDAGEVLSVIAGFVGLLIWVVRQIIEANKQPADKAAQPVPPELVNEAAPVGGQQADQLRNQVEEFLRRAGQQGDNEGPRRQPQNASGNTEIPVDESSRSPRRGPLSEPLRPIHPSAQPTLQSTRQQQSSRPNQSGQRKGQRKRRPTVAEHVAEHVSNRSRSLAEKTSTMGQRIIEEDRQFDSQLKAKFDHAVGTLASSAASEPELTPIAPTTPAAQIAAMLANPDGMRQAVIINEILRRPSDRW